MKYAILSSLIFHGMGVGWVVYRHPAVSARPGFSTGPSVELVLQKQNESVFVRPLVIPRPAPPKVHSQPHSQPHSQIHLQAHKQDQTVTPSSLPPKLDLASNEFKNSVEFKEANVAIESIGASTLYQPAPQYPQQAIEQDQQGEVLIEVETDEDGLVESARVVKSSGFVSLDEEGVATVWKWRLPANRLMIVPIRFQLSEQ